MEPSRQPWLIARLFDFSFERFVASGLIRLVYALLAVVGLAMLAFGVFLLFQVQQPHAAILLLFLAPLIYLAYLLILRLVCETLIVLFSIAEDIEEMRQLLQNNARAMGTLPKEE
jgi:Domain of unknown function (DUF4282)